MSVLNDEPHGHDARGRHHFSGIGDQVDQVLHQRLEETVHLEPQGLRQVRNRDAGLPHHLRPQILDADLESDLKRFEAHVELFVLPASGEKHGSHGLQCLHSDLPVVGGLGQSLLDFGEFFGNSSAIENADLLTLLEGLYKRVLVNGASLAARTA